MRSIGEHPRAMSATSTRNCVSCGAGLSVSARFCASCGARVAAVGGPIAWNTAERRYFGVLPGGHVLGRVRVRADRALAVARGRARLGARVLAAWVAARVADARMRLDAVLLRRERQRRFTELGDAVYRRDGPSVERARARIAELDSRGAAIERELGAARQRQRSRVDEARFEGSATEAVEVPQPEPQPPLVPEPEPVPHEPPGPVIVPEPEPVPHEPPGPVIVPEPGPVPHEPPGPVIVPEPGAHSR